MGISYAQSLEFRDSVMSLIDQRLDQKMPGPRYGAVQSGTAASTGQQSVILNGETVPVMVNLGAMAATFAGAIVKIDGPNNNRSIVDIVTQDGLALNAGAVQAYDANLYLTANGMTGGSGKSIVNIHSNAWYIQQVGTVGNQGTAATAVVCDINYFRLVGRQFYTDTMATTTSAANVRWAGTALAQVTSYTKFKLDIQPMDTDYKFLSLDTYSWRDKGEVERDENTTNRNTGVLLEEVQAAGYDEFLSRKEDGEIMGVEEGKFYSKLMPLMRDMHRRLNVLEGRDVDDRL